MVFDSIVIGGGISGLTAAHFLAEKGLKVAILEKSERLGGCIHTFQKDNYWIELGAHTCYNSYKYLTQILESKNAKDKALNRTKASYKVFKSDGKLVSIPSQLNFLQLLGNLPKIFSLKKEGLTVEQYYSKILGKGNYDKVLSKFFGAVSCQEAGDFPADMLLKRRKERNKEFPKSYTFEHGLNDLIHIISNHPNISTFLSTDILSLSKEGEKYSVQTNTNTFETEKITFATPPNITSTLIKTIQPKLSELTSKIGFSKLCSAGIIVKKENVNLEKLAGIVPESESFFSVVTRDVMPDDMYRGFSIHFKNPDITEAKIKATIKKVIGVDEKDFESFQYTIHQLPSLSLGHQELIEGINKELEGRNISITGNYFYGLSIEDCVQRSFEESERITQ
ncbi:protoporphyrinogen oxidase [Sediminitomix flava]|uniref:Protoporphyrinogen oxidase n=1 Tax=Sediminitomix flava TaxID=379075 RepID=A0A315ZE01_SEDFL|nr:protoporphyrinogen oxidase [Sediminitomix flava]